MVLKSLYLFPFLFIFLTGCFTINIGKSGKVVVEEKVLDGENEEVKILLLDLQGVITMNQNKDLFSFPTNLVETIKLFLDKAEKDEAIKAVVLKVNSPGGAITASDLLYNEILKFREKKKPLKIVSCFFDVAASGGYYISMASDYLIAHPTTITGSIGVIGMNLGLKKLLDKIGVEDRTVKSGLNKDLGSPLREETAAEKEILQNIIMDMHRQFVNVVATGRKGKLSKEQVEKLADGRPYTANQAKENGLIDDIGYLTKAIDKAKELNGITDPDVKIITYYISGYPINNIYTDPSALSSPLNFNNGLDLPKIREMLKNDASINYLF